MSEDYESIALGLKVPQPKKTITKNDHVVLSHPEASAVSRLPNSNEYSAYLRIQEGELEKLETEHMQNWRDKDLFERTGLIAVAARTFYERCQIEVNYHAAEFHGEEVNAAYTQETEQMSPEEFIRKGFGMEE